jgi:hypothetical protein
MVVIFRPTERHSRFEMLEQTRPMLLSTHCQESPVANKLTLNPEWVTVWGPGDAVFEHLILFDDLG